LCRAFDLIDLRLFDTVLEEGSITTASHLSPSLGSARESEGGGAWNGPLDEERLPRIVG